MKIVRKFWMTAVVVVMVSSSMVRGATPITDEFTFQGRLQFGGVPVNDTCDFSFKLWDQQQPSGTQIGSEQIANNVTVDNGLFTVVIAFGFDAFKGNARWMKIKVRCPAGSGSYIPLDPRHELTAAPYGLFSHSTRGIEVDSQNKVGIGTTAPAYKLDIEGGANPLQITGGGPNFEKFRFNVETGGYATFRMYDSGTREDFRFATNGNSWMNNSGNVGIGTTAPQAKLHIRGTGSFRGNHIAYFESTGSSSADGIAIQLSNSHTNIGNNFISFYNSSGTVTGRVEGFDLENGDWQNPPTFPIPTLIVDPGITLNSNWFNTGLFPNINLSTGTLPNAVFSKGTLPSLSISWCGALGITYPCSLSFSKGSLPNLSFSKGTFPSLSVTGGSLPSLNSSPINIGTPSLSVGNLPTLLDFENLMCWSMDWGISDFLTLDPVAIAANALKLAAAEKCKDEGVTYGSQGADYAEWLPKLDPKEQFRFGEIVGVYGGKISRKTVGAEQIMAVSLAPVVLGNLPPDNEKENYEKVGFMGKLPVVVRGKVMAGDYIIPSRFEDGTGIAVSPKNLLLSQVDKILGRAWSDSQSDIYGFVDVVIGVETNAATMILTKHQKLIQKQDQKYAVLVEENYRLKEEVRELRGEMSRLGVTVEKLTRFMDTRFAMKNVDTLTNANKPW